MESSLLQPTGARGTAFVVTGEPLAGEGLELLGNHPLAGVHGNADFRAVVLRPIQIAKALLVGNNRFSLTVNAAVLGPAGLDLDFPYLRLISNVQPEGLHLSVLIKAQVGALWVENLHQGPTKGKHSIIIDQPFGGLVRIVLQQGSLDKGWTMSVRQSGYSSIADSGNPELRFQHDGSRSNTNAIIVGTY